MNSFKKYLKSAAFIAVFFGMLGIIPCFLVEYGPKGLWREAVLKGIFFSIVFGILFVTVIFLCTYKLNKRAEDIYLQRVKEYSLEEEILFHERVAHRLDKTVYTDGVLFLFRDRLVYESCEYNVVLPYEEIVNVVSHKDFCIKLMFIREFSVKRYDGKAFVFRSEKRDEWIKTINLAVRGEL